MKKIALLSILFIANINLVHADDVDTQKQLKQFNTQLQVQLQQIQDNQQKQLKALETGLSAQVNDNMKKMQDQITAIQVTINGLIKQINESNKKK